MYGALELVRFTVKPENEAAFLESRPRLVEILRTFPGFVDAHLGRLEAATWVDVVFWESRELAEQAGARALEDPELAPLFALIDQVLAFEHADIVQSASVAARSS